MKKKVVCIFAHPDDEAFGPAGTISTLSKTHDVYIICATSGEGGKDSSGSKDIAKTRRQELRASAKILGAKEVFFLGFKDGTLCNNIYHELAEKIQQISDPLEPELFITFENKGISGHIDHIVVSFVATFVFYTVSYGRELWYYCITREKSDEFRRDYFIYFPKGYTRPKIQKTVDVSAVWDTRLKAMYTHVSQKHDAERIIRVINKHPKEEHFLVLKKFKS